MKKRAALCLAFGAVPCAAIAQSEAAPPVSSAMALPVMVGPLLANPDPLSVKAGLLGNVTITGALSGFAVWQDHPVVGDARRRLDLSNGQVVVQTTEGLVQFYLQAGGYSLPALGAGNLPSNKATDLYGALPVAFVKLAPNDAVALLVGKLPSLVGAEYSFSYENMNIEHGLLWNQTSSISKGVQLNLTQGPLVLSVSQNDGYYSDRWSWFTSGLTYTIDPENTLYFATAAALAQNSRNDPATPLAQNNSQIYTLVYSYSADPWIIMPSLQLNQVPANRRLGLVQSSGTAGAALMMKYGFAADSSLAGISLPLRLEYISSWGGTGSANLLYGPGSFAWSVTLSPTYQRSLFFARMEAAYVAANSLQNGSGFGADGNRKSQCRLALETGILF